MKFRNLSLLLTLSFVHCQSSICLASGISTNKTLIVETSNVLPNDETNFFTENFLPLTTALTVGGFSGGGGGGSAFYNQSQYFTNAAAQITIKAGAKMTNLTDIGAMSLDNGAMTSDGAGNLTVNTINADGADTLDGGAFTTDGDGNLIAHSLSLGGNLTAASITNAAKNFGASALGFVTGSNLEVVASATVGTNLTVGGIVTSTNLAATYIAGQTGHATNTHTLNPVTTNLTEMLTINTTNIDSGGATMEVGDGAGNNFVVDGPGGTMQIINANQGSVVTVGDANGYVDVGGTLITTNTIDDAGGLYVNGFLPGSGFGDYPGFGYVQKSGSAFLVQGSTAGNSLKYEALDIIGTGSGYDDDLLAVGVGTMSSSLPSWNGYSFTVHSHGEIQPSGIFLPFTNITGKTSYTANRGDFQIYCNPAIGGNCAITLPTTGTFGDSEQNDMTWTFPIDGATQGPAFYNRRYHVINLGSNTSSTLTIQTANSQNFTNIGATSFVIPNQMEAIVSTPGTNLTVALIPLGLGSGSGFSNAVYSIGTANSWGSGGGVTFSGQFQNVGGVESLNPALNVTNINASNAVVTITGVSGTNALMGTNQIKWRSLGPSPLIQIDSIVTNSSSNVIAYFTFDNWTASGASTLLFSNTAPPAVGIGTNEILVISWTMAGYAPTAPLAVNGATLTPYIQITTNNPGGTGWGGWKQSGVSTSVVGADFPASSAFTNYANNTGWALYLTPVSSDGTHWVGQGSFQLYW